MSKQLIDVLKFCPAIAIDAIPSLKYQVKFEREFEELLNLCETENNNRGKLKEYLDFFPGEYKFFVMECLYGWVSKGVLPEIAMEKVKNKEYPAKQREDIIMEKIRIASGKQIFPSYRLWGG